MMIVSTWTGAEVRALRTVALRLTQEQFAERLGFQPPTIRKWERATHERPVRGDLAAALDVELSRLTDEQRDRFTVAVAPDELRIVFATPRFRPAQPITWVSTMS